MAQKSVLLVEDDPDIQSLVEALLASEGIPVRIADDAEQALQEIRREKPALMLVDLTLPGITGGDLSTQVKREFGSDIRVVIMSAGRDLGATVRETGADDFLAKPFEVEDLIDKVKQWLS